MITVAIFALALGTSFPADVERVACLDQVGGRSPIEAHNAAAYFPEGAVSMPFCSWSSSALVRLYEPSLQNRESPVFRFLWLRSLQPGIAFRLEFSDETGVAILSIRHADHEMQFDPRDPALNHEFELSAAESRQLRAMVSQAPICSPVATRQPGLDGETWLLEYADSARYCLHIEWQPRTPLIRRLGQNMIDRYNAIQNSAD